MSTRGKPGLGLGLFGGLGSDSSSDAAGLSVGRDRQGVCGRFRGAGVRWTCVFRGPGSNASEWLRWGAVTGASGLGAR